MINPAKARLVRQHLLAAMSQVNKEHPITQDIQVALDRVKFAQRLLQSMVEESIISENG